MTSRTPTPPLAKISPPRLPRILERKRLFDELEAALARPAVWVSGPAGSGKTTLVASYLQARKVPSVWYQIDPGDADLATFFHFLGDAARQLTPRKRGALPHLTRGYLVDVEEFARRFFDALSQRVEGQIVLVFDDCHRLPPESPLYQLLSEVLATLPPNISAIFVSRAEPPPSWARLRANQALRIVGWEQLRLTAEETRELSSLLSGRECPAAAVDVLQNQVQGWVAGLVLLLEQVELPKIPLSLRGHGSQAAIFDYFAGEIFQRQTGPLRDFLLRTSVLPRIAVPIAEALSGNPRAGRILRDLARANYFTVAHGASETYEYHPLFLDFLRHRLQLTFSRSELVALKREAGRLLAEAGDIDAAAELFIDSEDWDRLAELVLKHARELFKQGRYRTLQAWLENLPADRLGQDPWLPYWLGNSLQAFDLPRARAYLDQAYRRFKQTENSAGTYLAWTAAVDTCLYVWSDFKELDYWLDELKDLQRRHPEYPSQEIEARVAYCMLNAMMRRRPRDPQIHYWSDRAESMLQQDVSLTYRLMIGNTLMLYYLRWAGNVERGGVVESIMRSVAISGGGAPLAEITWKIMAAFYYWVDDRPDAAIAAVEAGFKLAQDSGVHLLDFVLYVLGVLASLSKPDLAGAERYVDRMPESLKAAVNKDALSQYYLMVARLALEKGDLPRAREHAELVRQRIVGSDAPLSMSLECATTAQVLLETGDYTHAEEALQLAGTWARRVNNSFLEFHSLLCEAQLEMLQGREAQALDVLRRALPLGRRHGYLSHPWLGGRRPSLIKLYLLALTHGIEVDYVQSLVRQQRMVPQEPPAATVRWPWPVQIATLGRFALTVDGQALENRRGSRGKPLELLQALIAHGGDGVSDAVLTDSLWPDTDGDAAHHALETTLYRLRKLIGNEHALVLHNGLLRLHGRYCWVDIWAVQQLLRELDAQLRADAAPREMAGLVQRLRELYVGPFLDKASSAPWAEMMRERLHGQLNQTVMRLGTMYEAHARWQEGIDLYSWWMEQEPLTEEIYRRLMVCFTQLGRTAEAGAVFERCSRTLSSMLDVQPSAETVALRRSLLS